MSRWLANKNHMDQSFPHGARPVGWRDNPPDHRSSGYWAQPTSTFADSSMWSLGNRLHARSRLKDMLCAALLCHKHAALIVALKGQNSRHDTSGHSCLPCQGDIVGRLLGTRLDEKTGDGRSS
jgi:hypothetical protein